MRVSTKRILSFLVSLTLIVGGMVVYSVLVAPEFENIQRMRGTLESQTNVFLEQQRLIDKANDLLSKYKSGSQALKDVVNLTLPNDANVSQAVGNIQALAEINNLSLIAAKAEVSPLQAVVNAPKYIKNQGVVKISVTLRGAYDGFKNFLSQVENNVRIMDVKQMGIKSVTETAKSAPKLEYSLIINAYYQDFFAAVKN